MVTLELSEDQAALLDDVLAWWLEDFQGATDDTLADRTIDDPEEMLSLVASLGHQHDLIQGIRDGLQGRQMPPLEAIA